MAKMIIEQDAIGRYHINIGVGKKYSTRDIEELKTAVEHYYSVGHRGLGSDPNCPLCRAINEEMEAMRRKIR